MTARTPSHGNRGTRSRRWAGSAPAAAFVVGLLLTPPPALAQELIIGEARVPPGIVFIFEGAVRDHVAPLSQNLAENLTHVHIEARVNWDTSGIPPGTPPGGFVPYLNIHAMVTNEATLQTRFVTLVPHINLVDNFHYARNMQLPGMPNDLYTVRFYVNAPDTFALARHRDWLDNYGRRLMQSRTFGYQNVDFLEIVTAPPRSR